MADNSSKIAILRDLYAKGQISEDMFKDNVAKLQTLSQDMRPAMSERAGTLSDLFSKVKDKGGDVVNIADTVKVAEPGMAGINGRTALLDSVGEIARDESKAAGSSLGRLNGRFGKTLKALGILGPAAAALSIGDKAMAGEYGKAGLEAADTATDYVPVIGEVKQAIRPTDIGNGELPLEIMAEQKKFNDQTKNGRGITTISDDGVVIPDYKDTDDSLKKRYSFLGSLK
jgi:hypothetical protein